MKGLIFHVITTSTSSLSKLDHQSLVTFKQDILNIYMPLKKVCDLVTLICSAYILFSVSDHAESTLGSNLYHTVNPIIAFVAFVSINTCLFIKLRISKVYKATSIMVKATSHQKNYVDTASNDQQMHDSISHHHDTAKTKTAA